MVSDQASKIPQIGDLIRGAPARGGTRPDHETSSRARLDAEIALVS
jgi:hypothetical protein